MGVVVRIGLATGARWSEAEGLKQSQVLPGRITFVKTKGKKNRTVPISPQLQAMLPKNEERYFHHVMRLLALQLRERRSSFLMGN